MNRLLMLLNSDSVCGSAINEIKDVPLSRLGSGSMGAADDRLDKKESHAVHIKKRVTYIDLLKGITIIGVVLVHSGGCPSWWTPNNVNLIFFFLAGIFFKQEPFGNLIKKRWQMLIVPFLLFFIISYPFRLVVEFWDYKDWSHLSWGMLGDLFDISARSDYLYANVPLWFLLCLFMVTMIWWFISYLPKSWLAVYFISIMFFYDEIYNQFATPFFINNAFYYTLFFGLGNIFGKKIIALCQRIKLRLMILISSVLTMWILKSLYQFGLSERLLSVVDSVYWLCYCVAALALVAFLDGCKRLSWLEYLGVNSLIILCCHIIVLTPIIRISYAVFGFHSVYLAVVQTIICVALMFPVIGVFNRYYPNLMGKRMR